jgi:aspartyl-tRNA(Asn)/glutamyl-tRNA(Gln) amidotransferase subunit A
MYRQDIASIPSNLAGNASMSLPVGLSEGLPVGLQIIAPPLADDRLYAVGAALEATLDAERGHPLLEEATAL